MSLTSTNTEDSDDLAQDQLIDRVMRRLRRVDEGGSTYKTYAKGLRAYDEWLSNQGLTAKTATTLDIEDFILSLKEQGYAPKSIETFHTGVRKGYTMAVEKFEILDESPCDDVNMDDLGVDETKQDDYRHYITNEEFEHMRENCGEPYIQNRLILELLWQTGVRIGELRNIEVDNVDIENYRIRIWGKKTNEWRTVHYQPSLNRLMNIWIQQERPLLRDSEYLFPSNRSERLSRDKIRQVVMNSAKEINEVVGHTRDGRERWRITPHSLRHGHAVHALSSGVNVRAVQKQLGHGSIETTMRYLQLLDDKVAEAYQAFD